MQQLKETEHHLIEIDKSSKHSSNLSHIANPSNNMISDLDGSTMAKGEKKPEKVLGTNCYNCKFVADKEEIIDPKELNGIGGIDPKNKDEMKKAKKADLITLPGGNNRDAKAKRFCNHEEVMMHVTVRMCCAFWDNVGVKRPWE